MGSNIDTSIFKGYDIRGIFPDTINEDLAYKIGYAYAKTIKPKDNIIVGHDVRKYSEILKNKLIQGLIDAGVNVVDVGWISTDMLYFAVGYYKSGGGITLTASHNPPEWHGVKMVKEKVVPMTLESGISDIRDYILNHSDFIKIKTKGVIKRINILDDYCKFILSWLNPKDINTFKIVLNPNFGYGGVIFENIVKIGKLPIEIVKLNFNPDGSFPKGRPDPFIPENRMEFTDIVKSSKADFGITWDADSDRVFFCADGGEFINPYFLNTLLIEEMLKKFPNQKVIYDIRYTWALIDSIKENGGIPILSRVGHSYIKENMRKENALFAVESSGHTYYRDFWYADCGMIPPMQILSIISKSKNKLSRMIEPVMSKYFISDEINSEVLDKETKINEVSKKYSNGKQNRLDGIAVEYTDYRFVIRPSNTESLLRLTVEARKKELVEEKVNELIELIRN